MTIDLTGQTAVVTGAGNGIGRAIALAFLDCGAHVVAIDHDASSLVDWNPPTPGDLHPEVADVTDYGALQGIASGLSAPADHLVCAAACGSGKTGFPFWRLEPSDWGRVIDVTLMGTVNSVHAFTPSLLGGETGRKSVLLLASVAGQIGSPTDPPYSACKAATINFAQCAARDFAEYGIRVNAISPGMVQTKVNRSVWRASRESETQSYEEWGEAKVKRLAPLGRWQEVEEFGAMAVFLASPNGRNITGQTINIDGGQVMHS